MCIRDRVSGPFPELLVVASGDLVDGDPEAIEALRAGIERGYTLAADDPGAALADFLDAQPGLEGEVQEAQMGALIEADAFAAGLEPGVVDPTRIANWRRFTSR